MKRLSRLAVLAAWREGERAYYRGYGRNHYPLGRRHDAWSDGYRSAKSLPDPLQLVGKQGNECRS